jgi:hypothetical protein
MKSKIKTKSKKSADPKKLLNTIKFSGHCMGFDFVVTIPDIMDTSETKNAKRPAIECTLLKNNTPIETKSIENLKKWDESLDLKSKELEALKHIKLLVENIKQSLNLKI